MKDTLIIEGWRFISHSYALVNQWQLLSMANRKDIELRHVDAPLFSSSWLQSRGLFSEDQERVIASINPPQEDERVIAKYHIKFPLDFKARENLPLFVFGTSEYKKMRDFEFSDTQDASLRAIQSKSTFVVTPSSWSKEGFLDFGFKPENVIVIPHGFSPSLFFVKSSAERMKMREERRLKGFLFVNVSALTGNKGADVLLQAFAQIVKKYPDTKLFIKGSDMLYGSRAMLEHLLQQVEPTDRPAVLERLFYVGEQVSNEEMASLYHCADAYVCPYRNEGFNLPALEAAACGLPVIHTRGGPTDDFLNEAYHLPVESSEIVENDGRHFLLPNVEHLIAQMSDAIERAEEKRLQAEKYASQLVQTHSWDVVSQKLLDAIRAHAL